MKLAIFTKPFSVLCLTYVMKAVLYKEPPNMKLRYEHNKGFHDTCLVYLGNDQKRDFFRDFHKRDKLRIKSATFYPVIRITEITLINRNNLLITKITLNGTEITFL